MKLCPNCKAELNDEARFCIYCMTSLEEKEQLKPPARPMRRWQWVLLFVLLLGVLGVFLLPRQPKVPAEPAATEEIRPGEQVQTPEQTQAAEQSQTVTRTVDGVRYVLRPATLQDHPTAVALEQCSYFVLIRVEGTPTDGIYRVPSFADDAMASPVTVVADGAFAGTDARAIDLGHSVQLVWGNAFAGYALTDLYLHSDVWIDAAAFFGCDERLTIHCPDYLEDSRGQLWKELAAEYGFSWQAPDYLAQQPEQPQTDSLSASRQPQPTVTVPPTQPEQTTAPAETTEPAAVTPVLTYRLAAADDAFLNYAAPHIPDSLAVTGVATEASDGVYHIPLYVQWSDGTKRRVVGIDDYAFAGTNARKVYFDGGRGASSGIGDYAFLGCPLTDFYLDCSMHICENAFSGCLYTFTLHTDACNMDNTTDELFMDCAGKYGAVWKQIDWDW